jgi:hypothetical protein
MTKNGVQRRRTMSVALSAMLAAAILSAPLSAQAPARPPAAAPADPAAEQQAVLAAVQAFFDTMAAKDVTGARRVLMPEGRFSSVRERDGQTSIRSFTSEEYLKDLPGMKQSPRERMWDPDVRVRGRIATVWAPYDFWMDGAFSHCGIDIFNLIQTTEGWKLDGGLYTVESTCPPSPLGPLKQ